MRHPHWPVEKSSRVTVRSWPLPSKPITVYIDVDACPVKHEIYRVAECRALKGTDQKVFVVAKSPIAVPIR
jgi:hypothetical protein